MHTILRILVASIAGMAIAQTATGATLDRTVIVTNEMRPIDAGTQNGLPFEFQFSDLPMPLTGFLTITASGQGDFDGIDDDAGWISNNDGFAEILTVSLEGISLAFNGFSVHGPFGGIRTFSLSGEFGFNPLWIADGALGRITIGNGVDAPAPGDFLSLRIQYEYDDALADSDGDTITDAQDNCLLVPNPSQIDADGDGIGNHCDADLDNNCLVNFIDLGIMKSVFFSNDANADLNGDSSVNFADLSLMKQAFFSSPGPSGQQNVCSP